MVIPFQVDNSLTFWVSRLASSLQESFNRELEVLEVTWPQWTVINLVGHGVAKTPAHIAQLLGVDRSAITRLVDRLEKKGMVRRQQADFDKRSVDVVLTDAGMRLMDHLDEAAAQHQSNVLDGLDESLQAELSELIRGLLGRLDNQAQPLFSQVLGDSAAGTSSRQSNVESVSLESKAACSMATDRKAAGSTTADSAATAES